ncbi:hypothetical protein [Romboutsia sp.]|uniref:hypothetical protein n=1 Tax=Romboutsia sp. TaxID=1965302 RepID=UPI002B8633AC|nr:hypothetical protein [Romboutsia sp.]HSQ89488.1 hypothetical protein [Romboutsia sp.]
MKKSLIALGVVSLLGLGAFTMDVSASDQNTDSKIIADADNQEDTRRNNRQRNNMCRNLTEEQLSLIEKGYNELTQEEKGIYDKYHRQPKRDLSEEQLNEYHKIQDKVHKYMGEEFIAQMKERREQRKIHRQQRQNNQGQGNGSCNQ